MKTLLFVLLIFSINLQAQKRLKNSDKPEYLKYENWCNTPVQTDFYIKGKVECLLVNGYYADPNNNFLVSKNPKFFWYPQGTDSIMLEPNEKHLVMKVTLPVRRREPSVSDFYTFWKNKH